MKMACVGRRALHGVEAGCSGKPLLALDNVALAGRTTDTTPISGIYSARACPAQGTSSRPRAPARPFTTTQLRFAQSGSLRSELTPAESLLQVRKYASQADSLQTSDLSHANDVYLNPLQSASSTSTSTQAGTEEPLLREQVRQLRDLLIDATGRNPGKQRQIAWAAQEGGGEEEHEWLRRLEWAASHATGKRKTVVTVLGDSSEDLAKFSQALLSDPLASDQALSQALAARVQYCRETVRKEQVRTLHCGVASSEQIPLQNGNDSRSTSPDFTCASRFLADNNLVLQEILFDSSALALSPSLWTALLTSDIIIVQAEPPAPSDLYRLLQKRNVIFTSSASIGSKGSARILESVKSDVASDQRKTLLVNLDQAIQANSLLQHDARSSMGDFSTLALRSGIPQLSEHITNLAAATATQQVTIKNIIARAILDTASNLAAAHQLLYEAEGKIGRLALTTARDRKHSEIELGFTDLDKLDLEQLVSDSPPRETAKVLSRQTAVVDAKASTSTIQLDRKTTDVEEVILLEDGTKGVQTALSHKRLTWWKLPLGRADDIATDLAISLSTYFAGLERKLIFETGRLAERSLDLSLQVNTLLKSPIFARPADKTQLSLYSATMENEIAAFSPSTQFGFPPPSHPSAYNLSQTSLSTPIESRRAQLKAPGGAIERLQLRAQTCVVQFYTLSGASTAAAVFLNQTSWLQIHQDVPFCVGLAGLGVATAAWRLQGGWRKSKAKFWTDWKRAQEGLAYELQANANEVLNQKVFVKADVACKIIRKHLNLRKSALKELEARLRQAQNALP